MSAEPLGICAQIYVSYEYELILIQGSGAWSLDAIANLDIRTPEHWPIFGGR